MKTTMCPVCRSANVKQLYPKDINIKKLSFTYTKTPNSNKTFRSLRCKICSHVFCSPIPKNIYKNYEDVVDEQYLKYEISAKISAEIIIPLIKKYVSKGKLLDVGCATGEFLLVAKKHGYTVEGLELSKWSSEIAKERGIKVYRKTLKSLSKQCSGRYDVITLFGVIEHFEFPSEEIKYLNNLLKPRGVLVIWTGDVNSIMSKILRKRWWYWQGQHIQYFSKKSLDQLLITKGFKKIIIEIYPFVANYELMNNYLARYYHLRPWLMKLLKPFFHSKPLWVIRLPGEMLYMARKV